MVLGGWVWAYGFGPLVLGVRLWVQGWALGVWLLGPWFYPYGFRCMVMLLVDGFEGMVLRVWFWAYGYKCVALGVWFGFGCMAFRRIVLGV